jgi:single-strand DNA-binding protein
MKNHVSLIGYAGGAPEIRISKENRKAAVFSLATTETWWDKDTGEKKERTTWHRIIAWEKLADQAEKYINKGKQLAIEGRIHNSEYLKDGEKRYSSDIIAERIIFLGKSEGKPLPEGSAPPENASKQPVQASKEPVYDAQGNPLPEDDLPF